MNFHSELDYFTFRDHLAADIQKGDVARDPRAMIEHARSCASIEPAEAAEWVERFLRDAARHVERRGAQ